MSLACIWKHLTISHPVTGISYPLAAGRPVGTPASSSANLNHQLLSLSFCYRESAVHDRYMCGSICYIFSSSGCNCVLCHARLLRVSPTVSQVIG